LGDLNSSTTESPQTVYGITIATSIGLGESQSCAVLDNNYVACRGLGTSGQLGSNTTSSYSIPQLVRLQ